MLHMRWPFRGARWSAIAPVFLLSLIAVWPRTVSAQRSRGWTSTDVGSVAIAGSAGESGNTWTVQGSGADIWGTSDSFQFLHQPADCDAATAIIDVKPDGGVEPPHASFHVVGM
jgi:hypothetical protein